MEQSEWDDLDQNLDETIRSYASAEPPADLERRILQRARAPKLWVFSRWGVRRWYAAGLACTCAVVGLVVTLTNRPESRLKPIRPESPSTQAGRKKPASVPTPASTEKTRLRSTIPSERIAQTRRRRAVESNEEPKKRETFPSSRPLTAEERVMRGLSVDDYAKLARELVAFSSKNSEPLHIAEIVIKPLDESESK
jgi:hypothetical protein